MALYTLTQLSTAGWTAAAHAGTGAANMIDGNAATHWTSPGGQAIGNWVSVDLGAVVDDVAEVRQVTDTTFFARGFRVEGSLTGAFAGEQVTLWEGTSAGSALLPAGFAPVSVRYLRWVLTVTNATYNWRIYELQVFTGTEVADAAGEYKTDFREHPFGALSGWTDRWNASSWAVVADTASSGGRSARFAGGTSVPRLFSLDAAGTSEYQRVILRWNAEFGLVPLAVLRGSGAAGSENGYSLHASNTFLRVNVLVAGTATQILAVTNVSGDSYIEFEADGSTIRCRHWPVGGSPPAWDSVTNATHASGWLGLGAIAVNGASTIREFQAYFDAASPPEVTITSPLNESEHYEGAVVELRATATDAEDGDLTAAIEWTSDVDGPLGTGGSVDVDTLSVGEHTITASVEDADLASGSNSVTITIVESRPATPTLTATPSATTATLTGSAYSHPGSRAHQATEWDLGGTVVATGPVTEYIETGLTQGTLYTARRVRYQDEDGVWSDWAALVSYRTLRDADETRPYLRLTAITASDAAFESGPFLPAYHLEVPTTLAGVRYRFGLLSDFDLTSRDFTGTPIETTADLPADPGWEAHTFAYAWVEGTKYVAQVAHKHSDDVWTAWGSPEVFEWLEIDPAEYTPLWDVTRGSWHLSLPYQGEVARGYTGPYAGCTPENPYPACGRTEGYDAHRYIGVTLRGGVHDPAFLAYLPAGLGKAWRAAANVSIAGRGRWSALQYDLAVRSVQAGVGVAGIGTGIVGETPTWWGFLATLTGASGSGPDDGRFGIGWGGSQLRVAFIDAANTSGTPSAHGYAGQTFAVRDIPMAGSYPVTAGADANAGGYRWCSCSPAQGMAEGWTGFSTVPVGYPADPPAYRVELEVTQESPGVVRVKARVSAVSASAIAYSVLPPLDQDGWHINRLYGNPNAPIGHPDYITLQCGYAGYAGRSVYDIADFRDAWATFNGLTAECLDDPVICEPGTEPPWEPAPVPEYELAVTSVCGTVDIALLTGAAVDSSEIEIRRVDTLAVVYTGTSEDRAWNFAHGSHSLPYNTPLEVRGRYTYDGTPSEWTDWSAFVVSWELAECAQQPCSLYLICYLEDRLTVDWIVSTDADGQAPQYSMEPEHYGEQEVDFLEGRASIGEVVVAVVDPRQVPDNQDTGWMTERLADTLARGAVQGRRMQLIRWVDAASPPVVIADGPASAPRLRASYAGFEWSIRDTRETERRLQAFGRAGSTTLLPMGVLNGYGWDALTETWLADPTIDTPLLGRVDAVLAGAPNAGDPSQRAVSLTATPGNADALRRLNAAAHDALLGDVQLLDETVTVSEYIDGGITYTVTDIVIQWQTRFPALSLLWRAAGSSDPWQVLDAPVLRGQFTQTHDTQFGTTSAGRIVERIADTVADLGDTWLATKLYFGHPTQTLPAHDEDIEFVLVRIGVPSETLPLHVEGMTAGELLRDLYDGVYSPRDPETGAIVPTGIRYDEDALLLMTQPVRLRLTKPVENLREWAEEHIYAPLGYAPALDNLARISPLPQTLDAADVAGLTTLDNAIVSPRPEWSAGDKIINIVRWQSYRDYPHADSKAVDGLLAREIMHEYRDEESIELHGEQDVELEGLAFRGIGDENGDAIEALEASYLLSRARRDALLPRYSYGAPVIHAPAMREYTHHLRAGNWVVVDLSWMPDYVTRQRGLLGYGQIVAVRDLNCAWRGFTIELASPSAEES